MFAVMGFALVFLGFGGTLWILVRMYDYAHGISLSVAEDSHGEGVPSIVCRASFDQLVFGTWAYPFVGFAFAEDGLHIRFLRWFDHIQWLLPYDRIRHVEILGAFLSERLNIQSHEERIPHVISLWISRDEAARVEALLGNHCKNMEQRSSRGETPR
jgi:hypothetical protein